MLRIRSPPLAAEPSSVSAAVLAVSTAMCTRGEIIATPEVRCNIPQRCGRPRRSHRQPVEMSCVSSRAGAGRGLRSGCVRTLRGGRGVGSDGEAEGSSREERWRCGEGGEEGGRKRGRCQKKMSAEGNERSYFYVLQTGF